MLKIHHEIRSCLSPFAFQRLLGACSLQRCNRILQLALLLLMPFLVERADAVPTDYFDVAAVGPPLETADSVLAAALECSQPLESSTQTPILLIHGTSSTPKESWGFGYSRALPLLGYPTCTVELPARAWNDIQISTEFVVYAIRQMAARSGQKISIIGHSEGTMQPLWALHFWPDLASKIDDYIALAPPLQGTVAAGIVCSIPGWCPAAVWQYSAGSEFTKAVNKRPLPQGPSYTAIATYFDELVVPQPASSSMPGVTTVMVQALCPGRLVEHAGLLGDAATFAIAIDALTHEGSARLARVERRNCWRAFMPGIHYAGYAAAIPVFVAHFIASGLLAEWVSAEPPVRNYEMAAD